MMNVIRINSGDNVAVALNNLIVGQTVTVDQLTVSVNIEINKGHKIALSNIKSGENIIKYGFPIGHALCDIKAGDWIHSHNMKTNLSGISDYVYNKKTNDLISNGEQYSFQGYLRHNGDVGIRNEIWIVPTVGCVNGTAEAIINQFKADIGKLEIDNIMVLKHNYGCSQLGDDHENTKVILADAAKHPNAGGVLVLGLGCENNKIAEFKKLMPNIDESRVKFLISQEVSDEIADGVALLKEIYAIAKNDQRTEQPISKLKIGLKCGASDGFSGITANPLVGLLSDFIVSHGGSTILTEVPEMFGAETILMERAQDEQVFNKTVDLINDFKGYFIKHDQPVYENPSPGNKAGGITTLEEKSLGCTQKSGNATVVDVLHYGQALTKPGLNLLSAPGNDLVASSALAASGCQMVLFTTGRGTPFGSFVPTMKISTNSQIAKLKPHWIDFNAGALLENVAMETLLDSFIDIIIKTASGQLVNNEKNNFRELAIFKSGVTL